LSRIFGDALALTAKKYGPIEVILPTLPHLRDEIGRATKEWQIQPRVITGEQEKWEAFSLATGALAASGTVTLELALCGVPHVAAYRVPMVEAALMRAVMRVHPVIRNRSVVLANLVLGRNVVPEFLQGQCTPQNLAAALGSILENGPARREQIEAFKQLDGILQTGDARPSERGARAILDLVAERRK
jgi:lipid-A-disaccharide synthase